MWEWGLARGMGHPSRLWVRSWSFPNPPALHYPQPGNNAALGAWQQLDMNKKEESRGSVSPWIRAS